MPPPRIKKGERQILDGPYLATQRPYPSRLRMLPQLQLQPKLLLLGPVQLLLLQVLLLHVMQALHPLLLLLLCRQSIGVRSGHALVVLPGGGSQRTRWARPTLTAVRLGRRLGWLRRRPRRLSLPPVGHSCLGKGEDGEYRTMVDM